MTDQTRSIHPVVRWLMPRFDELGWMPVLWLVYLGFLYLPIAYGGRSPRVVIGTIVATLVFLPLYRGAFSATGRSIWPWIGAITVLGLVALRVNDAAVVFFIYSASFVAFTGAHQIRGLLVITLIGGLATWLDVNWQTAAMVVGLSIVVGFGNLFFHRYMQRAEELRESRDEATRMAAIAERERIARDMHDLLGHTLSAIALKSELAGKLIDRDDFKAARSHLSDLEKITRDALTQTRTAIAGFRSGGFAAELDHARPALASVGCELQATVEPVELDDDRRNALALALREALMNVVRHAEASVCRVELRKENDQVVLSVSDDGQGSEVEPAMGLTGLHERIETIGGQLRLATSPGGGFALIITAPAQS